MQERPILFSGPMVRALLDGKKTQTRRVVKLPHVNPLGLWEVLPWGGPNGGKTRDGQTVPFQNAIGHNRTGDIVLCPYGQPGDRLWVRENGWERPYRTHKMKREGADSWESFYYDADGITATDIADFKNWGFKRRPSIHMPRWASRITLEVTRVRVERLQIISAKDALAEGITLRLDHYGCGDLHGPGNAFRELWKSINGPDSWAENPWVWAVEFKQIAKGGAA